MNFSNEMIKKAKTAKSAEELIEMAKAEGVELSAADAETYFSFLKKGCQPLSDEELEQVAGGKGSDKWPPKYSVGQKVVCNGYYGYIVADPYYLDNQKAWYYPCEFENGWAFDVALEADSSGVKVVT